MFCRGEISKKIFGLLSSKSNSRIPVELACLVHEHIFLRCLHSNPRKLCMVNVLEEKIIFESELKIISFITSYQSLSLCGSGSIIINSKTKFLKLNRQ
jgi:hypothetical protein